MRRFASFVALALLLVSVVAPLASACACREAEAQATHSCCEETVLRSLAPGCCARLDAAPVPTPSMQPAPPPSVALVIASTPTAGLPASDLLAAAPRPPLRSFSSPPTVLRL